MKFCIFLERKCGDTPVRKQNSGYTVGFHSKETLPECWYSSKKNGTYCTGLGMEFISGIVYSFMWKLKFKLK